MEVVDQVRNCEDAPESGDWGSSLGLCGSVSVKRVSVKTLCITVISIGDVDFETIKR